MIASHERCIEKYSNLVKEYPEISIMDIDLVNCLSTDDYLKKNTITEYTRLARRDGINVSEDELLTSIGAERKKEFLYDNDDDEYR